MMKGLPNRRVANLCLAILSADASEGSDFNENHILFQHLKRKQHKSENNA